MDAWVNSRPIPLHCSLARADDSFDYPARAWAYEPSPATPISWLAEDGEFYVPDLLQDEAHEPRPGCHAAAEAHARHLRKAERQVDEALMLSEVLRASMADVGDHRAMQVEIVIGIVEKKLRKALTRIDRHSAGHLNLFMAYYDRSEPNA